MKYLLIGIISLFSFHATTQDSLNVLSYKTFINAVMEYHPYAYQAKIVTEMGGANLTQSRGAFDPKLFGDIDQKYFDDKQYYSHIQGGIKIPTWFGISAEAGYKTNDGIYLNPENRLPTDGLWYAGVRVELGNGLIIDQRRAEFEKAKLYQTSTKFEQTILLNQLQRDASIAYYLWERAYKELQVYQLAYENASVRLEGIKNSVIFGDRPYIDTVEASIIVQNRQLSLLKAQNYYENAELKLEMYLWSDGFIPLEINNMIPENIQVPPELILPLEMDSIILNNPIIQIVDLRLNQQKIDLRLKKEQLKPNLTLKYNAISEPINGNPLSQYAPSNYTWGASFSYPILSRKERGGIKLAKLKLQDQELKNKMSIAELEYTISSLRNSYSTILELFRTAFELVQNNERLYTAERELFDLGESSIFMVNSRESQWLKSQMQLIEIQNQCKSLEAELKCQLMLFGVL